MSDDREVNGLSSRKETQIVNVWSQIKVSLASNGIALKTHK